MILAVSSACAQPVRPLPTPSRLPPVVPSPSATAGPNWLSYHRDLARTGFARDGPNPASIHRTWTSARLDGAVFAEPLVAGSRVLVATEGDSVYALDALTGGVLWRTNVGAPVPGSALPCGNINPVGITSTPVVDALAGLIFVVAFLQPGRHELLALELATGQVRLRQPVDPPGANPLVQNQRAALALSHGMVYVAFGGRFGDCGAYHGWVAGVPAQGGSEPIFYQVPSERRAGIWAPSGPAVDDLGNLFVSTGNGISLTAFDHGNSVIKLSPELRELDFFAPTEWASMTRQDQDLGSVGPALLNDGLVFQVGKTGTGYLLRADHLGEIGGQAFAGPVCSAAFGGTAYAAPYLYVGCTQGVIALRLESRTPSFAIAWQSPRLAGESSPILAGDTVWAIDNRGGRLYGLDAATGQVRFQDQIGHAEHFATPTVAGGQLFVPADHGVIAYGS